MSFFYATLCAFSILVNNSCKQQATSASTSLFSNEGSKMKDEQKKFESTILSAFYGRAIL